MHSRHDSRETSKPGRDAANKRFEDDVDPDGVLPEAERKRRADQARKAYFTELAFKSARARRAASIETGTDTEAESP
jgi:hypothetical protein